MSERKMGITVHEGGGISFIPYPPCEWYSCANCPYREGYSCTYESYNIVEVEDDIMSILDNLNRDMQSNIDGKVEAEKSFNKVFHDGDVRVSKKDLNHLLYYNNQLYNIAYMLYEKLVLDMEDEESINETCSREGALLLMTDYKSKHRDLINKVALEKLDGKL